MRIRLWHALGFTACVLLIAGLAAQPAAGQEDTNHGATTQPCVTMIDITPSLNNIASNLKTIGDKVEELTDAQSEWLNSQNILQAVTAIILALTLIGVFWYACLTNKLHKTAIKANKKAAEANKIATETSSFAALTQVHRRLESKSSRKRRLLLDNCFEDKFEDVLKRIHIVKNGEDKKLAVAEERNSGENDNNTAWVFNENEIKADNLVETICQKSDLISIVDGTKVFNEALCRLDCEFAGGKEKAREVVEGELAVFDVLALPVFEEIEAAKKAAEAYAPVLERTAIKILPFVAMQVMLRGKRERAYKKHYLNLLDKTLTDKDVSEIKNIQAAIDKINETQKKINNSA